MTNNMINLSDLLNIYKIKQLNSFIKRMTGFDLEEDQLTQEKIEANWKFLGDNKSNGSSVSILKKGEKGLVERITNAIDAVIEKQKDLHNMGYPKSGNVVIKKAFPKYYENQKKVLANEKPASYAYDADNQVVLAINDGSISNKPTFDVIDKGTGIRGENFKHTILSINYGNKLSRNKSYLIGAFGQGGSTSLPFAEATIIISKIDNKFYFTIIKAVDLNDYKNTCYVYMTLDNQIPEVSIDDSDGLPEYLIDFVDSSSGTLVRMIETDISKTYRDNEITKPGMLGDYINTELFNVGLPVKLIENRKNYELNIHKQDRNSFGSYSKLQTWKYVQKKYCGSIDVVYRNNSYKVEYFVILPKNEEDWGKDSACKKVFEQFNVYCEPIIYIVNGQTVTTNRFTKLKNAGLNFLKYRLLIVIDLDVLGMQKYKFFTSNRSQIKETDLTHGFLDSVVNKMINVKSLQEINGIIAEKAISSKVDNEIIEEISDEVKGIYKKFLKGGKTAIMPGAGIHYNPDDEKVYLDHIDSLSVSSSNRTFYKDQLVKFILTTKASKFVNRDANIYCYIDDKACYSFTPVFMNGRIQYSCESRILKAGEHNINFNYFEDNKPTIKSNTIDFEILDENDPNNQKKLKAKELDLNIELVEGQELVCDISKNINTRNIFASVCLESDLMSKEIYGFSSTADAVKATQIQIIKPIVLFCLFLGDNYDEIESTKRKNDLILSFIKTFLSTTAKK